jgi:hypothetical protein
LIATTQKLRIETKILGLDMTSAFDTINRKKLLEETKNIFNNDEWRMVKKLLNKTTLQVRLESALSKPFETTIGSPQGDSLSPILFTVYLDGALRQLRKTIKRPATDKRLPPEICYADDTDFLSHSTQYIEEVRRKAPSVLKEWDLVVNDEKTDLTTLKRDEKENENWRATKKLGTLLGDHEELKRRKQLAAAAFQKAKQLWANDSKVREKRRLRIYNSCVKPILTYNMGTWALTQSETAELDAFHRRQLRAVINVCYPNVISNEALYERTKSQPIRHEMFHARWRMLGHTLRMSNKIPAKKAMITYFEELEGEAIGIQGKPRTTLPNVINKDIQMIREVFEVVRNTDRQTAAQLERIPCQLKSKEDLFTLEKMAKARTKWRKFVDNAHALLTERDEAI